MPHCPPIPAGGWQQGEKVGRGGLVRTRQGTLNGEADGQDGHQGLVRHGVDDCSDNGFAVPASRNPAIEKVGHAGIGKEAHGPGMCVVEDQVADDGSGDESRERQEIRDRVYIFVKHIAFDGGRARDCWFSVGRIPDRRSRRFGGRQRRRRRRLAGAAAPRCPRQRCCPHGVKRSHQGALDVSPI